MVRKFLVVFFLLGLLQGCLRQVKSNVAVFHSLPTAKTYGTVFLSGPNDEISNSLEFRSHSAVLGGKLAPLGFRVVDSIENADYLAVLSYAIDSGRQETSSYTMPQRGSTTSYVGGYAVTTYGVTGYKTVTDNTTVYTRQVALDIFDVRQSKDKPTKVYEARATSQGTCGTVTGVLPHIVDAILTDFPGTSGESKKINVEWNGKC
mgnify:FL=1